jgi:hydrocephalus-inducing protein
MDLIGSINYPNAEVPQQIVDFGSVLQDTHKSLATTVTNTSEVPVQYHWELDVNNSSASASQSQDDQRSARQLFDIKPIQGYLAPGQQETSMLSYFAYGACPASATAVLHVAGGPSCTMMMKASPNSMSFQLEPQSIDCGVCLYTSQVTKEVTLVNSGRCVVACKAVQYRPSRSVRPMFLCLQSSAKVASSGFMACRVPFDWHFFASGMPARGIVSCTPASGNVPADSRRTVSLKIRAGMPAKLRGTVHFEVAHFKPTVVNVAIHGAYASIVTSLPRHTHSHWQHWLQAAVLSLQEAAGPATLQAEQIAGDAAEAPSDQQYSPTSSVFSGMHRARTFTFLPCAGNRWL